MGQRGTNERKYRKGTIFLLSTRRKGRKVLWMRVDKKRRSEGRRNGRCN
jgi:hypothetical protein